MENFETQLAGFLAGAQAKVDADMAGSVFGRKLFAEAGKRYVRIVARDVWNGEVRAESGSAWCFIDTTNGDILKAASWKAPAKHARGNIMGADFGVQYVTARGAYYLAR